MYGAMLRRHTKTKVRFKFIRMLMDHFMMINNTAKKKKIKKSGFTIYLVEHVCFFN